MPSDEKLILHRSFPQELEQSDGRTLHGRIIPYERPTMVADLRRDGSFGPPYEEMIARGAFARDPMIWGAPNRVKLQYEHRDNLGDQLGHGVEFKEEADGLYGTFRLHTTDAGNLTQPAEQGLALFRAGILRFFSIEIGPMKKPRLEGGVMVRHACRVNETSLVREAAYQGTEVASRAARAGNLDAYRTPRDAELDRRLAVLGFGATE